MLFCKGKKRHVAGVQSAHRGDKGKCGVLGSACSGFGDGSNDVHDSQGMWERNCLLQGDANERVVLKTTQTFEHENGVVASATMSVLFLKTWSLKRPRQHFICVYLYRSVANSL